MKKKITRIALLLILPIVAVIVFVSAGTSSVPECPPDDPLGYTVMLPDPDDCSIYYMCSDGVAILQKCPDGLHFNPVLCTCDIPSPDGCHVVDGKFLNCVGGGVEHGTFQMTGTITILGCSLSGSKGQIYVIAWERWACEDALGSTCDSAQGGVRIISSSVG